MIVIQWWWLIDYNIRTERISGLVKLVIPILKNG